MFSTAGFYFIPEALSIEEQYRWIKESLVSFPEPPNRTNHNAVHGAIHDLFNAAKDRKVLVEEEKIILPGEEDAHTHKWEWATCDEPSGNTNTSKSISASVLLRKLRWSTLGLQFDWSKVCLLFTTPNLYRLFTCRDSIVYIDNLW